MIPTYSGLEPLRIFPGSNFVNIGERTNVTGSALCGTMKLPFDDLNS